MPTDQEPLASLLEGPQALGEVKPILRSDWAAGSEVYELPVSSGVNRRRRLRCWIVLRLERFHIFRRSLPGFCCICRLWLRPGCALGAFL